MPKLTHLLPKYRRHPSGQAFVEINGQRHLLGPYNAKSSTVEYDRIISEWLASGRSSAFGRPDAAITITELIVDYLEFAGGYYGKKPRGEYANVRLALRCLRSTHGEHPADEFGPLALKAVRQRLIESGNSRSYINGQIRRIVRMFRWGVSEERVPPEVLQALEAVPGLRAGRSAARETDKVRPASETIVEACLPFLSPILQDMVKLHRLWGCRPGELVLLRPCDIDTTEDVWEYRPAQHKNQHRGQDRCIYIGPKAQEILRPYLGRCPDAYCFSPAEAVQHQRAVRTAARQTPPGHGNRIGSNRQCKPKRQPGDHYTSQSYLYAVRRACDKAFPVPHEIASNEGAVRRWRKEHRWTPNQLRHSVGTLIRREFGVETAKAVLGHSSRNTTGIYAEMDQQRAVEAARRVG